jgi:hypothetical protein
MAAEDPKPRKTIVLVTDAEWRAIRVAAAEHDTSIQGYITLCVLSRLQAEAGELGPECLGDGACTNPWCPVHGIPDKLTENGYRRTPVVDQPQKPAS